MADDDITIRRDLDLDETASEVWDLIASPDGLATWFADEVDVALVAGGQGTVTDDGTLYEVAVDERSEHERLSFTWWPSDEPDAAARVELTMEPTTSGATRVHIVETWRGTAPERGPARASAVLSVGAAEPPIARAVRWELRMLILALGATPAPITVR